VEDVTESGEEFTKAAVYPGGDFCKGGDQSDLTYNLLKSCCLSEASGVAKKTLR